MHYHHFILQLGEGPGGRYSVHVESPAGQGAGTFELPGVAAPRVLRNLFSPVALSTSPPVSPHTLGAHLFEALFRGEVRQLFDQSWGQVKVAADQGLRLQIRLNPRHSSAFELAEVPWELLYRPDTEQFLALSRKSPVSRHLVVPQVARPPLAPSSLRVLAVLSNPEGTVPLALERERSALEAALGAAASVEMDFRPLSTAAELRQALLREGYPVIHFMGHGDFAPGRGEGWLLFEDEDGRADLVPGRHLADELRDCPSLQLVLLNACSTGRFDGRSGQPFAGVAAALVLAGVPAVVAMRAPISDRGAIAFSSQLYRHLAEGDPLDAAVTEGRLAVQRLDRQASEWSIPVLFLSHGGPGAAPSTEVSSGLRRLADLPDHAPQAAFQAGQEERIRPRAAFPRSAWMLSASLFAALLGGLLYWPVDESPFRGAETAQTDEVPPTEGGTALEGKGNDAEGAVLRESTRAPELPPVDLRQLQAPPYQGRQVQLYLKLPASSGVDISGWKPQVERVLSRELASVGLQLNRTTHAEWLVVMKLSPPALSSQQVDGRNNQVCQLHAEYELLQARNHKGEPRFLRENAGQLTAARACETAVQRLAERVGQDLLAVYLEE